MSYQLYTGVWEVTMACNMRCKHCGSSCMEKLPGELDTKRALHLCDELGELGMEYITLSGGEPTLRADLFQIITSLRENNIIPNIITNGWNITEEFVLNLKNAGIGTVAISIDGLEATHDYIRRPGSFLRSMNAFHLLSKNNVYTAAITTVNKKNLPELNLLKEVLIEHDVNSWQIQIGLPMGNMLKNDFLVTEPSDMSKVVDFAYNNLNDNRIRISFGDCIGYYDMKYQKVMEKAKENNTYLWQGCGAGKTSLGILHNGDILGCTSIREKEFIEGNICEKPLKAIWENELSFSWNRNLTKEKLTGFCGKCRYGDLCLGGCSNTRLTMEKDIYQSNRYCLYFQTIKKEIDKLANYNNFNNLILTAKELVKLTKYQSAQLVLERALEIEENNLEALKLYAFVNYQLQNYTIAKKINEKALEKNPYDSYLHKGFGLTLYKLGEIKKGIDHLYEAIYLCDENYLDPYYDCAVTLLDNNNEQEAIDILQKARNVSGKFYEEHQEIYEQLGIA